MLFVRHGESEHHVRRLTGGSTDLDLTARGRRQAESGARRVAALLGDHSASLFTSPLRRARESAQFIGRALAAEVVALDGLRELHNGAAQGLTLHAAKRIERPLTQPALDWIPYDGAESWRAMIDRVHACMEGLASVRVAVVVGHGGSGMEVLNWWLGLDAAHRLEFTLDPGSVSELARSAQGERGIVRINDTSHLAGI